MSTKEFCDLLLSAGQFTVVLIGAIVTYFRFWREGVHSPRIEFNVDCQFFGPQQGKYLASFTVSASNKGSIEHKFEDIRLSVRGIKASQSLQPWKDHEPRVEFPETVIKGAPLIPERFGYYFVRPGVTQTFAFTSAIPEDIRFIVVRTTFKYSDTKELHTAEKTLEVKTTTGN